MTASAIEALAATDPCVVTVSKSKAGTSKAATSKAAESKAATTATSKTATSKTATSKTARSKTATNLRAIENARAQVRVLMPAARPAPVRIRCPLAESWAGELGELVAPTSVGLSAATVTACPDVDVRTRAELWAAQVEATGGGVWLVEHDDRATHYHGVVVGTPEVARRALSLVPGGLPDAQHIDTIVGALHLRRVVQYATRFPTWDPARVVSSGVLAPPWYRVCSRAGVPGDWAGRLRMLDSLANAGRRAHAIEDRLHEALLEPQPVAAAIRRVQCNVSASPAAVRAAASRIGVIERDGWWFVPRAPKRSANATQ